MDTIISRFKETIPVNKLPDSRQAPEHQTLLSLACDLYRGSKLSSGDIEEFEKIVPKNSLLYILRGDLYLHPAEFEPVATDLIWSTINNDCACIFNRRINSDRSPCEMGCHISAAYIGKNRFGDGIAAGILFREGWFTNDSKTDCYYNSIGMLKRIYGEITRSFSIRTFLEDESSIRFIARSGYPGILKTYKPSSGKRNNINPDHYDIIENSLVPELLHSGSKNVLKEYGRGIIKEIDIRKQTIIGDEFSFISIKTPDKNSIGQNRETADRLTSNDIFAEA